LLKEPFLWRQSPSARGRIKSGQEPGLRDQGLEMVAPRISPKLSGRCVAVVLAVLDSM
jgi:hypothetical protein